ncbi:putative dihydropyrimidinase [Dictyocaulus viviparus]|uniref:Putative dihydropyrimidinase n=1 Tax=Dictyocaulus viviparus TaxID=29172 RepID=A0A0D8XY00_DICVI|nr:putative dihydropyrimidinase [Dictyocaulus viviparus]
MQFYTGIPDRSDEILLTPTRRPLAENKLVTTSRPTSRNKSRSPHVSQPTSARSAKSSPIPLAPPEVSRPSRHRNKGLETSSAMMELFGGGSSYGATSVFDHVPQPQDSRSFHRKNVLEKELQQLSDWEMVKYPPVKAPFFTEVEDHNMAYERARKRGNWRSTTSQFDKVAQPGPEWYEDSTQPMMEQQLDVSWSGTSSELQKDTYNMQNDWKHEFKEDVVENPYIADSDPEMLMKPKQQQDVTTHGHLIKTDSDDGSTAYVRDTEESCAEQASRGAGGGDMSLAIRGAQIVNDDSIFFADVYIKDGVIRDVGPSLEFPAGTEIVEAAGKMLLPAGIDVHTYFNVQDSADDLATSCKAAVAGGTATVIDVVSPKAGESLTSSFFRVKGSLSSSLCNIGLSVVVQDWSDVVRKEMEKVVAEGVNSFIINIEGEDAIYQVMEQCRTLGVHARFLPENRTIVPYLEKKMLELGITGPEGFLQSRPEELECECVNKLCVLSQLSNCPISMLSVSSAESVLALERARHSGALAHVEIAGAAIATDGTHYFNKCLKHATAHMTEVPLRTEGSRKLVSALANQPLVVCTSGHRAISSESRLYAKDFTSVPKGTVGVEERMCIVWEKAVRNGRIDPMRFVAVTSTNAAKIFNLYPKKGRIAVGADADLVLWDASGRWKLSAAEAQSSVDFSLYEGMTVHAKAFMTIVGGNIVWRDGKIQETKGAYVPLLPQSPYLFSVVQQRDKVSCAEKVEREDASNASSNGHIAKRGNAESSYERPAPLRKSHLESNITFGGENRPTATRIRNPPGGRSTGFW